jgi:hypothetical protein
MHGRHRWDMNLNVHPSHMGHPAACFEAEIRIEQVHGPAGKWSHLKKPKTMRVTHRKRTEVSKWDEKGERMVEGEVFRVHVSR